MLSYITLILWKYCNWWWMYLPLCLFEMMQGAKWKYRVDWNESTLHPAQPFKCGVTELTWVQSQWGRCNLRCVLLTYNERWTYEMNRNVKPACIIRSILDWLTGVCSWPKAEMLVNTYIKLSGRRNMWSCEKVVMQG